MTEKKYPEIAAGVLILNNEGKILVTKSPKWNMWVIPGGHIEFGEDIDSAIIRESKEEVGLNVKDPILLRAAEFIKSPDFNADRHLICLNYLVKTDDTPDSVQMEAREISDYLWLTPEEILKNEEVHESVKESLKVYLNKVEKKKGFFGNKECKNCADSNGKSEEYKKDWQRALADYKNLQKETSERRGEWAQMSKTMILEDFIPVYDNFKTAFYHHPVLNSDNEEHKQIKSWIDGIGYIMKQFGDVLKSHGIEEIKTVGEKFDPTIHESVGEEEVEEKESGVIVKEVSGGYKMGDKVVKVARVIIAK